LPARRGVGVGRDQVDVLPYLGDARARGDPRVRPAPDTRPCAAV